jgi:drug/metabolite transporter (DMT)-like permease
MTPPPPTASPQSRPPRWALPALLLGVIAIGFSPILVRLSEVGPVATAFDRMALPLPVFFAALWARPAWRLRSGPRDLALLALGGVFFAADLGVWHWSLKFTTVANATFLANLTPAIVVLLAWLLFKERVGVGFLAGLGLALAGSALLTTGGAVSTLRLLGDGLSVLAAIFYAGYLLTVARVRRRVSALATIALGSLASAVVLLPVALATEVTLWPASPRGWAVALALAILCQIAGQLLLVLALKHVPTGFGSTMLLLQPVMAAILAWMLFGEVLQPLQIAGGAAILIGLAVVQRATPEAAGA